MRTFLSMPCDCEEGEITHHDSTPQPPIFFKDPQTSTIYVSAPLILGLESQISALKSSGVRDEQLNNDNACSSSHIKGDIANSYCHAFLSELARQIALDNNLSPVTAHTIAILQSYAKELTDKNLDLSDIHTGVFRFNKENGLPFGEVSAQLALNGNIFFSWAYQN